MSDSIYFKTWKEAQNFILERKLFIKAFIRRLDNHGGFEVIIKDKNLINQQPKNISETLLSTETNSLTKSNNSVNRKFLIRKLSNSVPKKNTIKKTTKSNFETKWGGIAAVERGKIRDKKARLEAAHKQNAKFQTGSKRPKSSKSYEPRRVTEAFGSREDFKRMSGRQWSRNVSEK